jgi:2-(1,2-epoxy-1,2-dihydrophenyl)acetyl-CoA isomerase
MIYESVEDDQFTAHWTARAQHLAKGPTVAYAGIKEALHASANNSFTQQLALEAKLQGRCGTTRDFREGVVAFTEKRAAKFEGR